MKRLEKRSTGSATRLRFESLESRRLLAAVTAPTVSTPVISLGLSDAPTIVTAPALPGGNLVNASPAGRTQILDIGLNETFSYSIGNGTTNFAFDFDVATSDGLSALQGNSSYFHLTQPDASRRLDQIPVERLEASNLTPAIDSPTVVSEYSDDSALVPSTAHSGVKPSRSLLDGLRLIQPINENLLKALPRSISAQNGAGASLSTTTTLDIAVNVNESLTSDTAPAVTDLPQSSDLVDLRIEAAMELQASGNQINTVSMSSFRVEPVMARHHRIELNPVATETHTAETATKPAADANKMTAANTARSATVPTASHRDSTDARMATSQAVRGIPRDHQVGDDVRVLHASYVSGDQSANSHEGGEVTNPQTVDGSNAVAVPILTTEESVISTELGTPLSSDQPREDWERAVEVVMAVTVGAVVWTQQQRESEEAGCHSLRQA